jgi:hypothetical protein
MTCGVSGVSAFIRSFDKDAKWLERTLPVFLRLARGYDEVVVCGISGECKDVQRVAADNGVPFVAHDESAEIANGYINQQYSKLCADQMVKGDKIVYIDSDCICTGEHTPEVFFQDGKPLLMYSEWGDVGQALCWRMPTEHSLGLKPKYEFMRRLPTLYPASVVRGCREYMEKVHGRSLLEYLCNKQLFSEFNTMGCYAYEFRRDEFRTLCPQKEKYSGIPFRHLWSHGSLSQLDPYLGNG